VSWKPDETRPLPDGSEEQIRYRRTLGRDGSRSRIRKVVGPDGQTREIWHEVIAPTGEIVHQHPMPIEMR
jgi:hypothetical protein